MKNIGIIGLGYVGLTLGILAADLGYKVYGVEVNEQIKAHLKSNEAHFYEPGINDMIERNMNENFFVVDEFIHDIPLDAIIVTVGTPLCKEKKEPNYEYLLSALEEIEHIYTGNELIILRSTVSVGTTNNVVIPHLQKLMKDGEAEIKVAFCPERTVEGKAIKELQELPQIISGNTEKALSEANTFFARITDKVYAMEKLEEAEIIKLFNNTYRDVNFAIGNMFNQIAQKFGLDGNRIINAANKDYSRSKIALPGLVGGPCLEKDVYILTENAEQSFGKQFLLDARRFNESLEDEIVSWIVKQKELRNLDKNVVLSGMAFKGTPETSDLRGSNAVNIAYKLQKLGYTIYMHDFCATVKEMNNLMIGSAVEDFYEAIQLSDVVVLLNNNKKYSLTDTVRISNCMPTQSVILDTWGVLDKSSVSDHIRIYNLGNYLL